MSFTFAQANNSIAMPKDNNNVFIEIFIMNYKLSDASILYITSYPLQRAAMMVQKSGALSEAPPMSPPSTSGLAKSSAAFLALQEPP